MGRAAEWYGRRGYPIFPVHSVTPDGCSCGRPDCETPGKHPLIIRWPDSASQSKDIIRWWWHRWPEANIGLVTGAPSGLVVLDVDPRHGGTIALEDLEAKNGELPATVEAETGSGGRHILFKHPETRVANSAGSLGPGLDVRGDGGYIVAPPSLHACGRRYTWDSMRHPAHMGPAPLPEWLLEKIGQGKKDPVRMAIDGSLRELASNEVSQGQRNTGLARLAGHLLRCHVEPYVALGLLKCWNQQACRPPLTEDELIRTVDSIAGAELRRRQGR